MPLQRPIARPLSFPLKRNMASYRGEAGAVPFTDQDVRFDINNPDYLLRSAAISVSDSNAFTLVMRVNLISATDASAYHVVNAANGGAESLIKLNRATTNKMKLVLANNDVTYVDILDFSSTSNWNASTGAKWVMISGSRLGTARMYWGETSEGSGTWAVDRTLQLSAIATTYLGWLGSGLYTDMEISAFYLYATEYDPSVESNRRLFYAADGVTGHVPPTGAIIQFGGTSTYSATDWNAGTNLGSGGNFTMTGEVRNKPETYAHEGVVFDGTNDYLVKGSALTGVADGSYGTLAFKFRPANVTSAQTIFRLPATTLYATVNADGTLTIFASDASESFSATSDVGDPLVIGTDYTIHCYWDGVADQVRIYKNGALWVDTTFTIAGSLNLASSTNAVIGATLAGAQKFNGRLYYLWFTNGTTSAAKVTDTTQFYNGGDVDLGVDGTLSGAPAPILYFGGRQKADSRRGYAAKGWNDLFNQGSGGAFATLNGSVTDV